MFNVTNQQGPEVIALRIMTVALLPRTAAAVSAACSGAVADVADEDGVVATVSGAVSAACAGVVADVADEDGVAAAAAVAAVHGQ